MVAILSRHQYAHKLTWLIKCTVGELRSTYYENSTLSYVHTCAGRLRSGGGRILTFPLRYRGYVHTYAKRTRGGRGRICHFLRTMMVWSARFRSGRGKLGVGPISCGAVFAPAPPPLRDRACVNTCNDLCWSQFSARLRPRPPAHVWTYLYVRSGSYIKQMPLEHLSYTKQTPPSGASIERQGNVEHFGWYIK